MTGHCGFNPICTGSCPLPPLSPNNLPVFDVSWVLYNQVQLTVNQGLFVYNLPSYSDADGDTVTVSVNLLGTSSFATFNAITRQIKFDLNGSGANIGPSTFQVEINLSDQTGTTQYLLNVVIVSGSQPVVPP